MHKEKLISKIIRKYAPKTADQGPARSIDIIGDIAVLKMPNALQNRHQFAEALLKEAPNIKVVYRQTSPVSGNYRLRDLEWLAGERRSITTYKEDGCIIEVDLEKDYFSPRLAFERTRIAKQVKAQESSSGCGQVIVNMFAGVGTFSLRIAKDTKLSKIYSIDMNPDAFIRMFRNVLTNKMSGRIVCMFGDAVNFTNNVLEAKADRVLMPLPEKSLEYIGSAVAALKHDGGIMNIQNFTHAGKGVNPVQTSRCQLQKALQDVECRYSLESERVIRSVGPGWYQIAHDVKVIPARGIRD